MSKSVLWLLALQLYENTSVHLCVYSGSTYHRLPDFCCWRVSRNMKGTRGEVLRTAGAAASAASSTRYTPPDRTSDSGAANANTESQLSYT